jgi:hypothetical protein
MKNHLRFLRSLLFTASSVGQGRTQWLDENDSGKLFADGEARVAHLANEIGLAGQQPNDLIFAKAELAQAVLHFRGGTELFDAHRDASTHAA